VSTVASITTLESGQVELRADVQVAAVSTTINTTTISTAATATANTAVAGAGSILTAQSEQGSPVHSVEVARVGRGALIGDRCALDAEPVHSVTAVVTELAQVLELSLDEFR
jgi:hypothetical protein